MQEEVLQIPLPVESIPMATELPGCARKPLSSQGIWTINHHFDFLLSHSVCFLESHVDRLVGTCLFVSESFAQHKLLRRSSNDDYTIGHL